MYVILVHSLLFGTEKKFSLAVESLSEDKQCEVII